MLTQHWKGCPYGRLTSRCKQGHRLSQMLCSNLIVEQQQQTLGIIAPHEPARGRIWGLGFRA